MKPHVLTPNTKTETPTNMIFFDTEAYVKIDITEEDLQNIQAETVEKEHDTYLLCSCFVRKNKKGEYKENSKDYAKELNPNFKEEFWKDVDKFTQKKKKTFIFAHNAKYDVLASACIPELVKYGYKVTAFSDSNPFFLKLTKDVIVGVNFETGETITETEKSITIVSSTNYYQFSLKKLGECFKIPKLEIEYENPTLEDARIYCRQDVLILKTAMLAFIKFIQVENLGNFKLTIAGQAFTAYRHRFLPETSNILIHRTTESLITERKAYAGGRNEAWIIGPINKKVFYVDVNSMYPYVMKNNKYPVKLLSYRKKLKIDELKSFIDRGYLVCATVELCTAKNIYFKKEGKLIFPTGSFKTTLSTPELIKAIKYKQIVKIYDASIYESDNIFTEYVNYFYNKRLEAKAAKDEVLTLLYKLFLNALYGKFGQKNLNWERIGDADPTEIREEIVYNAQTRTRQTFKIFGGSVFVKCTAQDGENEAFNSFPAIAAHVTSYARMLLWSFIEVAGESNIYYMDTDSLFCTEEGYNNLLAAGLIDDKELGKLKLEVEAFDVTIRGCKDYSYKYHCQNYFKCNEGKECNVQECCFDGIVDIGKIKGVTKKSKVIDDNTFVSTVWAGFSKFIKEGDLSGYKNTLMVKKLTREYTKGTITENGQVKPFIFIEGVKQ